LLLSKLSVQTHIRPVLTPLSSKVGYIHYMGRSRHLKITYFFLVCYLKDNLFFSSLLLKLKVPSGYIFSALSTSSPRFLDLRYLLVLSVGYHIIYQNLPTHVSLHTYLVLELHHRLVMKT